MLHEFEIAARLLVANGASTVSGRILVREGIVDAIESEAIAAIDRRVDLRDLVVVPAFIDAHIHLVMAGLALEQIDLSSADSRSAFEAAIAAGSASLDRRDPAGSRWLEAWGWSAERWRSEGSAAPDRRWLAAAGDRPAIAWRMDRHACLVNGAALRLIEARHPGLPALAGGTVERDDAGTATGLFVEANAWQQVLPLVPPPSTVQRRDAVRAAVRHLHRHGIAAAGSMEYATEIVEAIVPAASDARDPLQFRLALTILDREWPLDLDLANRVAAAITAAGRSAADALRVIGFKAFADGTLGLRTARMLDAYADRDDDRGMLVELVREGHLDAWAERVWRSGASPSVHAIGDEAFRLALDAFDRLAPSPERIAPRLEHCQTVHEQDLSRLRGRMLSMQPLHRVLDARMYESATGGARLDRFYRFRDLLDAGASLAFGSDWPVVEPDALAGIRSAVTARIADGSVFAAEQSISPREAIEAYTAGSARCLGFDDAGSIEPGRRADLVVLDRDPFATDWFEAAPQVLATIVGGEVVFDREGLFTGG